MGIIKMKMYVYMRENNECAYIDIWVKMKKKEWIKIEIEKEKEEKDNYWNIE